MMASALSKRPCHVYKIGLKVVSYLASTIDVQLQLGGHQQPVERKDLKVATASSQQQIPQHRPPAAVLEPNNKLAGWFGLTGYSDASFAPFGGRSYGCSLITLNGSVVSWKCARQAFTTMSVAEAELYEAAQATLLLQGVHALIQEILGVPVSQMLLVDNAAAVSLISGCQGSWRTRHLKVRCAFITDLVQQGILAIGHVCGLRQLADLPTKLHTKARMLNLMSLWGFVNLPRLMLDAHVKVAYLLCLILALQVQPVEATSQEIPLVGFHELAIATVVVCIAAVGVWELVKKGIAWMLGWRNETPKEKRLRRLREFARSAAEEELDKERLRRELEAEAETLRRPLRPARSNPPLVVTTRSTGVQTPPLPEPRVETRVIYQDRPVHVPDDVPVTNFWKTTDHRSKIHTSRDCHGLRNAGAVFATEYCNYCENRVPLRTRAR